MTKNCGWSFQNQTTDNFITLPNEIHHSIQLEFFFKQAKNEVSPTCVLRARRPKRGSNSFACSFENGARWLKPRLPTQQIRPKHSFRPAHRFKMFCSVSLDILKYWLNVFNGGCTKWQKVFCTEFDEAVRLRWPVCVSSGRVVLRTAFVFFSNPIESNDENNHWQCI